MRTEPTRYREVVLTSCHSKASDCRPLNIMLVTKLHQYGLVTESPAIPVSAGPNEGGLLRLRGAAILRTQMVP